ncbi:MAG: hypothetical protein ABSG76_16400 [Xanthobacteraceae bacterium]|jgi:hypothetical protein
MADTRSADKAASSSSPLPMLALALPDDKLIPLAKFGDDARQRIMEIAATVSIADSNSIMTFGSEVQPVRQGARRDPRHQPALLHGSDRQRILVSGVGALGGAGRCLRHRASGLAGPAAAHQ